MTQGMFITFEGVDGSGKTTQIELFRSYLENFGYRVELTREPGGTKGGEEIRSLLLTGDKERWDPVSEILMFSAARREHILKKIKPCLEEGKIVISDRFADATRAYQGAGYSSDDHLKQVCASVYKIIAGDFQPNLTLVLDLPVEEGLKRSKRLENKEQRFESMELDFHYNLRKEYLQIVQENPDRCLLINAEGTIDEVQKRIQIAFQEYLKDKNESS